MDANSPPPSPAPPAPPVFRLQGVGKRFGHQWVLREIGFEIAAGERVAIIGPSGAGKTTLFRLLCAVLPADAGQIEVFGQPCAGLRGRKLKRMRRDIGVLYQSDNLIPQLRVVHNVLMGRLGRWSLPRALISLLWPQDLPAARAALERVELADRLWAMPGELSGGQQQRVALARLLVQQPRVMLADEPVSQLDIRLGREIIELLSSIATTLGNTLLVNLHTLELLQGHFQRVLALKDGRLFWQGPPAGLNRELLRELYGTEYQALYLEESADVR
ncbi:phosphonate ABC transporter ATP-binding protein [Desulfurivibrio alkaliphilus]|uniref:ABC transporter related protein n=1 Tax=Desulfurivibrio alkaliphilus (strain DSM 19089 / UNIQEM U267 / AHT2) TaxID=589865 RepID=D6Z142_DESAT|nr:ATP-binding cassette domain-containing protein [Desulfurivibrio alkaliphilus]ADH87302.1 ABC transporter related protein [Desulfurivibrio alkaliphilus AHT 2]